ncbi:ABC transporter F family member 4-like [Papaver somniferum]|uniref:ABC transporter F family member 4-like n=1 Tax=Papaver somniferum TaxID=3469 RepID=UPI000E6F48F1|nr:ABC transporter F family member 4-like [Papaver somniferum]
MVASEPGEGESTKTKAEMRYGSLITRIKLKDPTKLGKLDVENEILRIMKLKPKLDREIEINAEDLYWFAEHHNSMTPINEQGFPRFLRLNMKSLLASLKKKEKKNHEADLSNFHNDKDIVYSCVDTLHEIISFNKALKSEDERDDVEQEEEEGEKGEKSGKGGDADDSDDNDDEEGDKGKKSGKGGDVDDSDDDDSEKVKKGGGDLDDSDDDEEEEEKEGGKRGDLHDDDDEEEEEEEEKEGSKGGNEEDRTESENNEVPSETPEKPSTPSSKTNEINEEKDMGDGSEYDKGVESETANKSSRPMSKSNEEADDKDGTSLGVESETANKPSTSLPKTNEIPEDQQDQMDLDNQDVMDTTQTDEIDEAVIIASQAISHLDPKGILPFEEDVILLTQGENPEKEAYTSIDDLLDNLFETVFIKIEKGCYRTTPSEVKEKMITLILDCPSFSLLSQEDPKKDSSQK